MTAQCASLVLLLPPLAGCAVFGPPPDFEEVFARVPAEQRHRFLDQELRHAGSWDRVWAAEALGVFGDREDVPALIEALDDPDTIVQSDASRALAAIGDSRAAAPLFRGVAAGRLGPSAIRALGSLGDSRGATAVLGIVERGRGGEQPYVYYLSDCAQALGELRSREAIHILQELLANPKARVRREAALALGRIGEPRVIPHLVKLLDDVDHDLPPETDTSVHIPVAEAAAGALGMLKATRELVAALDHRKPLVREAAARALGGIEHPAAREALVRALHHSDQFVRRTAVEELMAAGGPDAKLALQAARQDESELVRSAAVALPSPRRRVDEGDRNHPSANPRW